MLDCIITGDSIAVMAARALPECRAAAIGGISSWQANHSSFTRQLIPQRLEAGVVAVSLGTNDNNLYSTLDELLLFRSRISALRVLWFMPPIKPPVQRAVEEVANRNGDRIIWVPPAFLQSDGIHPNARGVIHLRDAVRQEILR